MREVISAIIVFGVAIPAGVFMFILGRNELMIRERVTGGLGMPVIVGFAIIVAILPVIVFLSGARA